MNKIAIRVLTTRFIVSVQGRPSKIRDARIKKKARRWFYNNFQTDQQRINFTSFNNQEGEE